MAQGPLGRAVPQTLMTGALIRAAEPRFKQPGFDYSAFYMRMRTPCEVAALDVLVHRDLFDDVRYDPTLFSDLFSGQLLTHHHDCDKLSLAEKVQHLGRGLSVARMPAMPRYRDMLQFAFDRAGWDSEHFDVYRISMEYPITPTDLVLRHELPAERQG